MDECEMRNEEPVLMVLLLLILLLFIIASNTSCWCWRCNKKSLLFLTAHNIQHGSNLLRGKWFFLLSAPTKDRLDS